MKILANPHRHSGPLAPDAPYPSVAAGRVAKLLAHCPVAGATPLVETAFLAGPVHLWIKDERQRMGLGSFKALGAAYVIARHATEVDPTPGTDTLKGRRYITASAGNHGLSVAAGARVFGAHATICIADTVPQSFADRLAALGAEVRRSGPDYASAMAAAERAAAEEDMTLLSDSSWEGYFDLPHLLMEGYTQMAAEIVEQAARPADFIFLQAGVGGLAASVAAYLRDAWGAAPKIVVVEPEAAAALQSSIAAGAATHAPGPDSSMGRLDCKDPSLIALNGLARDADVFVTLSDKEVEDELPRMAEAGFATSPSGGAGLALAMMPQARSALGIKDGDTLLTILSEGPA